jgi:type VI secretion system protein ImpM
MSEPALTPAPGWYGKLPALGDFASRRLPPAFIQAWDDWLQQGLATARDEWGSRWLERYLVAPIVRFWLREGVLGHMAWAGLVMPSVDRVGRHFPLTLAAPAGPLAAALGARAWFGALDAAARRVLDVAFTVEDFESALATVPGLQRTADTADEDAADRLRTAGSIWWCGDAALPALNAFAALPPPRAFVRLLGGAS